MNYIVILTLIYMMFLLISLVISNGRLITPGVLFFGSIFVMLTTCAILDMHFGFRIKELTFWIIIIAGIIFFLVEQIYHLIINKLYRKTVYTNRKNENIIKKELKPIFVQEIFQNIFLVFTIFTFFLAIATMLSVSGDLNTWNEMMALYRSTRLHTTGVASWNYFMLSQSLKMTTTIAYIYTYILIYNKQVYGISLWEQKKLIVTILFFVPGSMIGAGARQTTVELILFIFLMPIMLSPVSRKRLKLWKILLRGSIFIVVFVLAFTASSTLVGRKDTYRDPLLYVAEYLCGGLANFNAAIGNPGIHKYWGQATIANIYSFLSKLGLFPDDELLVIHKYGWSGEYVSSTTVTIFGRWYEDFGALGVYIMTGIVALLFAYLLYSICDRKSTPNVFQIIYLKLAMALVWAGYDDRIYVLIGIGSISEYVLIGLLYWLLIGKGSRYRFVFKKTQH